MARLLLLLQLMQLAHMRGGNAMTKMGPSITIGITGTSTGRSIATAAAPGLGCRCPTHLKIGRMTALAQKGFCQSLLGPGQIQKLRILVSFHAIVQNGRPGGPIVNCRQWGCILVRWIMIMTTGMVGHVIIIEQVSPDPIAVQTKGFCFGPLKDLQKRGGHGIVIQNVQQTRAGPIKLQFANEILLQSITDEGFKFIVLILGVGGKGRYGLLGWWMGIIGIGQGTVNGTQEIVQSRPCHDNAIAPKGKGKVLVRGSQSDQTGRHGSSFLKGIAL